jgi:hypothetical protein
MNALRLWSRILMIVVGILTAAVLATPLPSLAQQDLSKPILSPEQQQRLALMKSKSAEASLTILPIRLAGKPFDRVTEFVGLSVMEEPRPLPPAWLDSKPELTQDSHPRKGNALRGEFCMCQERFGPLTEVQAFPLPPDAHAKPL